MDIASDIKKLLEKESVSYQALEHPPAFTAAEVAHAQHIPGHQMIKSIVVSVDGKWVLCVMSATHRIDFDKLKKAIKARHIQLASESEVSSLFPEFEVGAMPPIGLKSDLIVYVDADLRENEIVAFNAGTHTQVLKIKLKDFLRLANSTVIDFAVHI